MRLSLASIAILFFAEQITSVHSLGRILPKPIIDVSKAYRHYEYIANKVNQDPHAILNHGLYHQRDVIPSATATDVPATASSPAVESPAPDKSGTWDKDTEAACRDAVAKMNTSPSNASGMTACYNIRYFNKSTGIFQADLRLYRMALPTGDWASVTAEGMSIGLSCPGASLAAGNANKGKRGIELLSWSPIRKAASRTIALRRSTPPSPQKLQDLIIVGKIHDDQMGAINDPYVLHSIAFSIFTWRFLYANALPCRVSARSLLFPTIALSGTAKNGQTMHTQVSTKEATFVNGAFADQATNAAPVPAAAAASPPAAGAQRHGFVLPGMAFRIFPTGFVITGVWALLFVGVVGAGTVDRIRFREAYRRRVKREMTVGLRMI